MLAPASDISEEAHDLQSLLARESVEDIVLSPRGLSYFENLSWYGPYPSPDAQPKQLWQLAGKIAEESRLQLGLTQPTVDSFLRISEGLSLRAHVAIPPLVSEGPEITLRRLPELGRFGLSDFAMTSEQAQRIKNAVTLGFSVLVSGSTGAGKTSFLTALLGELPRTERVLILEDSPELPSPGPLSSKLLCRSDRFGFREGACWTLEDLVFESLRMRPDRLVIGECRSREAVAIRHALQTGHRGTWSSIHAANVQEASARFNALSGQAGQDRVWDLIIQLGRAPAGQRAVMAMSLPGELA